MGNLQKNIISGCEKRSKGNRSGDRINSDLGWGYCVLLGGLRGPLWGGDMWAEYWRMRSSHHGEIWGKSVLGRGNSKCKGSEEGRDLGSQRTRNEASVCEGWGIVSVGEMGAWNYLTNCLVGQKEKGIVMFESCRHSGVLGSSIVSLIFWSTLIIRGEESFPTITPIFSWLFTTTEAHTL